MREIGTQIQQQIDDRVLLFVFFFFEKKLKNACRFRRIPTAQIGANRNSE